MLLHSVVGLAGLAQTAPTGPLEELAFGGSLLVFILVVTVVSYLVNAFFTFLVGAPLVAVAADWFRNIEHHASDTPIRSGAVGFVSIIGCIIAYAVFVLVVLFAIEAAGLSESAGFIVIFVGLVGVLCLFVMTTIGEIIAGSALLKRFGDDEEPSLWVALVIAALVVNAAYVVPLAGSILALVLVSVATGAIVDRWWQGRGGDAPPGKAVESGVD